MRGVTGGGGVDQAQGGGWVVVGTGGAAGIVAGVGCGYGRRVDESAWLDGEPVPAAFHVLAGAGGVE
eukprot:5225634-Prymnesium_polylepis.1